MVSRGSCWLLRAGDLVFLLRPILLVPVWLLLLAGYYRAGGPRGLPGHMLIWVGGSYTLLMAALYIVNQIVDQESDRLNDKHLLVASGVVSPRVAGVYAALVTVACGAMSISLRPAIISCMGLSLVLGIAYSMPPFRFKGLPVVDLALNALGYGGLNFALGWLAVSGFSAHLVRAAAPYVLAVGAIYLNTTTLDISGDDRCGCRTTSVVLGPRRAAMLALFLLAGSVVCSGFVRDPLCGVPGCLALPLFVRAAVLGTPPAAALSVRVGGPLMVLAVGIVFPWFLAGALIVFLFLRWYYRVRFRIVYPSLSPSGNPTPAG